jgi:hypothetical protein
LSWKFWHKWDVLFIRYLSSIHYLNPSRSQIALFVEQGYTICDRGHYKRFPDEFKPKFIIANRFEINDLEKDLLGRGGMGVVPRR